MEAVLAYDIEKSIKDYLDTKSLGCSIYLQRFPREATKKAVMIEQAGSVNPRQEYEVDVPRIKIVTRADHPKASKELAFTVRSHLHRLANKTCGGLYIYWGEINGGPERIDDPTSGLPQHIAYYIFIIRES